MSTESAQPPSFAETRTKIEAKARNIAIWAGIALFILFLIIMGYIMMTTAASTQEARNFGAFMFVFGLLGSLWLGWKILINTLTWVARLRGRY